MKKNLIEYLSIGPILLFIALGSIFLGWLFDYQPWVLLVFDLLVCVVFWRLLEVSRNSGHYHRIVRKYALVILLLAVVIFMVTIGISIEHFYVVLNLVLMPIILFFLIVINTSRRMKGK